MKACVYLSMLCDTVSTPRRTRAVAVRSISRAGRGSPTPIDKRSTSSRDKGLRNRLPIY